MENQTPPDSNFVLLARRLEHAPQYLLDYLFGLLAGVVSDILTTSLTIAAVLLGFATGNWWIAGAFFFTMYTVTRVVNGVANAIGITGHMVSQAVTPPTPPTSLPFMGGAPPAPPASDDQRIPVTLPASNG